MKLNTLEADGTLNPKDNESSSLQSGKLRQFFLARNIKVHMSKHLAEEKAMRSAAFKLPEQKRRP